MADVITALTGGQDDLYDEIIRENLSKRILIFNDEVNESVLENYILHILKWNREDKEAGIPIDKRKCITIYINSPGGSSIDGFSLVSAIQSSTTKIRGVCFGLCASMGYHIFLACHERIAFRSSILLQHDGSLEISSSTQKAKQTMAFFDEMDKRTKEFVLSRTNMTEEFYDSVYDQEYWFYAYPKGKELGCVDKIIGEDCTLDDIL